MCDRLKVENTNPSQVVGTVRIFLLPLNDDKEQQFLYEGSRKLAIELDRFLVNRENFFFFSIFANIFFKHSNETFSCTRNE